MVCPSQNVCHAEKRLNQPVRRCASLLAYNRRIRRASHAVLLLLFAALLMSGCGGDSDDGAPPPNPGTSPSTASGFVFVNHLAAGLSAYRMDDSGRLSAVAGSPFPVPSSYAIDPSGNFVVGLTGNTVQVFRIDRSTGALSEVAGSPFTTGAEASEIVFHPNGRFLYVVNQFDNFVAALSFNTTTGAVSAIGERLQTGLDDPNAPLRSIAIDPNGRFLFVAANGIASFAIDSNTGLLSTVPGSPVPDRFPFVRSLTVHPSGRFLFAALGSFVEGKVRVYPITQSGLVGEQVSGSPFTAGQDPLWVAFDSTGRFAFVANAASNDISVFSVNTNTGALTLQSTTSAGNEPISAAVDASNRFLFVSISSPSSIAGFSIDATTGALTSIASVPTGSAPGIVTTVR